MDINPHLHRRDRSANATVRHDRVGPRRDEVGDRGSFVAGVRAVDRLTA